MTTLAGTSAKIARANEHIDSFIAEVEAYVDRSPYRLDAERNAEATEHRILIWFSEQPDFARWGTIIGDCLNNLRSALDPLLYDLAVSESGVRPPPKEKAIQFPIAESPAAFTRNTRHIEMFSTGTQAAIERLQPYNRPSGARRHPLLLLNELNNADKHRLLHLAVFIPAETDYTLSNFMHEGETRVRRLRGPLANGVPVRTIYTTHPEPNLHVKYDASHSVSIEHPAGPDGVTYSGVDWILESVRAEVLFVVDVLRSAFSAP